MPLQVLISGAGVAGTSLALLLAKTGAIITVLEKAHTLLPHGQNVDIQGAAVTAVRKMGLLDEIRRFSTKEKGTQLVDTNGRSFARFPVKDGSVASFTSEFEILRGDLAAILYDAAKDHANVKYLFGNTITQVISNDEDSVKVELSSGEVREYDLLVAADGQWSKVRKQCFDPEEVKSVHLGMYAVYYTIPRLPNDNDWWNIYIALESRIITTRPDPHGTTRAMFTYMPSTAAEERAWREASRCDRHTQEKLLRKTFTDAGWEVERLLEAVDQAPDFYFHVIQQIKMPRWSKSRVVCLGDTAYAPSPLTGMGTSLAIIGAYMLAGELSKFNEGNHPSTALDAYESKFRPFVEQEQNIPMFFPSAAHPGTAWKRWVLHTCARILSALAQIPWIANKVPDAESNDDGFQLPGYAIFDTKAEK